MKRIIALWTLAAVAISATAAGGQDPPKPAEAPKQASPLTLTATLDKGGKYVLPEEMQIEVKLENTSDKDVEINELSFEESSLSFNVKAEWTGGAVKEYVLAVVRPDPHVKVRLAPNRVTLGTKKSLTFLRRFPTLAPGKFTITAHYQNDGADIAASPATAEVAASSAGNKLVATVTTAQQGSFSFELKPQEAPVNVSNFVELVRRGFYKDLIFHRVVPKNWVQTGCPYGLGIGGPGYTVKSETEPTQTMKHEEGTVSMAGYEKTSHHGSQFFVCLATLPALDGKFTIIGKVPADQMEVVRTIGKVDVDKNTDRPRSDVRITDLTISVKN